MANLNHIEFEEKNGSISWNGNAVNSVIFAKQNDSKKPLFTVIFKFENPDIKKAKIKNVPSTELWALNPHLENLNVYYSANQKNDKNSQRRVKSVKKLAQFLRIDPEKLSNKTSKTAQTEEENDEVLYPYHLSQEMQDISEAVIAKNKENDKQIFADNAATLISRFNAQSLNNEESFEKPKTKETEKKTEEEQTEAPKQTEALEEKTTEHKPSHKELFFTASNCEFLAYRPIDKGIFYFDKTTNEYTKLKSCELISSNDNKNGFEFKVVTRNNEAINISTNPNAVLGFLKEFGESGFDKNTTFAVGSQFVNEYKKIKNTEKLPKFVDSSLIMQDDNAFYSDKRVMLNVVLSDKPKFSKINIGLTDKKLYMAQDARNLAKVEKCSLGYENEAYYLKLDYENNAGTEKTFFKDKKTTLKIASTLLSNFVELELEHNLSVDFIEEISASEKLPLVKYKLANSQQIIDFQTPQQSPKTIEVSGFGYSNYEYNPHNPNFIVRKCDNRVFFRAESGQLIGIYELNIDKNLNASFTTPDGIFEHKFKKQDIAFFLKSYELTENTSGADINRKSPVNLEFSIAPEAALAINKFCEFTTEKAKIVYGNSRQIQDPLFESPNITEKLWKTQEIILNDENIISNIPIRNMDNIDSSDVFLKIHENNAKLSSLYINPTLKKMYYKHNGELLDISAVEFRKKDLYGNTGEVIGDTYNIEMTVNGLDNQKITLNYPMPQNVQPNEMLGLAKTLNHYGVSNNPNNAFKSSDLENANELSTSLTRENNYNKNNENDVSLTFKQGNAPETEEYAYPPDPQTAEAERDIKQPPVVSEQSENPVSPPQNQTQTATPSQTQPSEDNALTTPPPAPEESAELKKKEKKRWPKEKGPWASGLKDITKMVFRAGCIVALCAGVMGIFPVAVASPVIIGAVLGLGLTDKFMEWGEKIVTAPPKAVASLTKFIASKHHLRKELKKIREGETLTNSPHLERDAPLEEMGYVPEPAPEPIQPAAAEQTTPAQNAPSATEQLPPLTPPQTNQASLQTPPTIAPLTTQALGVPSGHLATPNTATSAQTEPEK